MLTEISSGYAPATVAITTSVSFLSIMSTASWPSGSLSKNSSVFFLIHRVHSRVFAGLFQQKINDVFFFIGIHSCYYSIYSIPYLDFSARMCHNNYTYGGVA